MRELKIRFGKFKLRFRIAMDLLFNKKTHFFIVWVNDKNLRQLLIQDSGGNDYSKVEIEYTYHGLQPYNVYKMIEIMYDQNDKIDMMLLKAKYEADATTR